MIKIGRVAETSQSKLLGGLFLPPTGICCVVDSAARRLHQIALIIEALCRSTASPFLRATFLGPPHS